MSAPSFIQTHAPDPLSQDKLERVRDLCRSLGNIQLDIELAESELRNLKESRRQIAEKDLPDLFSTLGLDRIGDVSNSVDYVLEEYCNANLPKDPHLRAQAIDYLSNNHQDLLGVTVTAEFDRGDASSAHALRDHISAHFNPRKLSIDEGVHHSTLTAFVRRCLKQGISLPLELLGAHVGPIVKMKPKR